MSSVVVLVSGPSASGKSELIAGVERIVAETGVLRGTRVAPRTTTRPVHAPRSVPLSSGTLDLEEFHAAVCSGVLDVHWRRMLEAYMPKRYGFALARELAAGDVVILRANNYLDWRRVPLLTVLRAEGRLMVVRAHASLNTRLTRLRALRPRPEESELAHRFMDLPPELLPPADHVVRTDRPSEQSAAWDLLRLITSFRFATLPCEEELSHELTVSRRTIGDRIAPQLTTPQG
ncbi:MAG TPA: hypothetical protein VFV03_06820 [Solirubrobacteraceae bacterium]|nr:hypothetical protein [Solirubrobacteraceae bacterium]